MQRIGLPMVIWFGAFGLLAYVLPWMLGNHGATENVRGLFREDSSHAISPRIWFLALCLLVPISAHLAARLLLWRWYLVPVMVFLAAPAAGWACLRYAVTPESIRAILGSPDFVLPYDLGCVVRFTIVFGVLWIITLLGFLPGLCAARAEVRERGI